MGISEMLITFDGLAASGKSTCARLLAEHLGWPLLSTGLAHRMNVWLMLEQRIDAHDGPALRAYLDRLDLRFAESAGRLVPLIGGVAPAEAQVLAPDVRALLPHVTRMPAVCHALTEHFRVAVRGKKVVAEGHGLGTGIFPDADLKFFCAADPEVRTLRRWRQEQKQFPGRSRADVDREITERDRSDQQRPVNPVRQDPDMITLDTGRLSPEQCLVVMLNAFESRTAGGKSPCS